MSKLENHSHGDDAVSPVIGVMLMIVVTVVIAAVVALFATSVATETKGAPVGLIRMKAENGDPDVNDKLVMSIIGGNPLELSNLKCVVTIEDGEYGVVFKSLDTDPNVGKFLEIGKQLEICNLTEDGMKKLNSVIGGSDISEILPKFQDLGVGDKINVMVVFNENAVLYQKDIIIQDGVRGTPLIVSGDSNAKWTLKDGKPAPTKILFNKFKIAASPSNDTGKPWLITITNVDDSTEKVELMAKPNEGNTISGINVNGVPLDETKVYSGSIALSVIVSSVHSEEFTVTLGALLLYDGDSIEISVDDGEQTLSKTQSGDPGSEDYVLGKLNLSVGSKVSVTINYYDKEIPGIKKMFTYSKWAEGSEMNETRTSTGCVCTLDYIVTDGDFGTDTRFGFGKNPIYITYGDYRTVKVNLPKNADGSWTNAYTSEAVDFMNVKYMVKLSVKEVSEGVYGLYVSDDGIAGTVLAKFTLTDSSKVVKSAMFGENDILNNYNTKADDERNLVLTVGSA